MQQEFLLLNKKFLTKYGGDGRKFLFFEMKGVLDSIQSESNPKILLEERASIHFDVHWQEFCHILQSFAALFTLKPEFGGATILKYFTGEVEDWLLLYLDFYLQQHKQGRYYLTEMLREGLFQSDVAVIYQPADASGTSIPQTSEEKLYPQAHDELFNSKEEVEEDLFVAEMITLFSVLDMALTQRREFTKFRESLETVFYSKLLVNAFYYMKDYMELIQNKKLKYSAKWYIFDLPSFFVKLQEVYETNTKGKFGKLSQEPETAASYAFVGVLHFLIIGELKDWSLISDIPYDDIVRDINVIT